MADGQRVVADTDHRAGCSGIRAVKWRAEPPDVDLITAIGNHQRCRARLPRRSTGDSSLDVTQPIARKKATTPTASRSGDVPCATSKPSAGDGDRDDDLD